jgi:hypothetical protein
LKKDLLKILKMKLSRYLGTSESFVRSVTYSSFHHHFVIEMREEMYL